MSLEDKFIELYDKSDDQVEDELIESLTGDYRYRDFEKLSSGEMKTVYKAFDEKSQRYVAYARLNDDISDELNEVFVNEARLTAKLSHPNIIPIYDVGADEKGRTYFTMELKMGDSLQEILSGLKRGDAQYLESYPLTRLLNIFIKICDALACAHDHNVIHLDIKPDNIQIGHHGEVMVCDWGLSKVYDGEKDKKHLNQFLLQPDLLNEKSIYGEIKGTPGFMAPEQVELESVKSPQTDVYALGAVLYAMLSYRAPYLGGVKEVLELTKKGTYEKLEGANYDKGLLAVVYKALSKDIEGRYQRVDELKNEIEHHLLGYATQAEKASSLTLLKRFVKRNPWLSVFILLVTLGTLLFIQQIVSEKARAEANLLLLNEQKDKTDSVLQEYHSLIVKKVMEIYHIEAYENPKNAYLMAVKELNKLKKVFKEDHEIHEALGYLHFVAHKFEDAERHFLKANSSSLLLPLAQKYKPFRDGTALISGHHFLELMKELGDYQPLHLEMLIYYSKVYYNMKVSTEGVRLIMKHLNPNWDPGKLQNNVLQKRVMISGKELGDLGGLRTPLKILNMDFLDVSETNVKTLDFLEQVSLQRLDIRGLEIPFKELKRLKTLNLKELVVMRGQLDEETIAYLSKRIQLIYKN